MQIMVVQEHEMPFSTDADRWEAVLNRDASADGHFWYSVESTGVYCRPSCAARRANRENVRFHQTTEEAERTGFRPCKRCHPEGEALAARHAAVVARACRRIERSEEPLSLAELATGAGLSAFHFHRVFKAFTGLTPRAYAAGHRAKRMREELTRSGTVSEAIYRAGFVSSGRFYESARAALGMTPSRFKAGGVGEAIRFAVGQCSLGAILVAASERGVCAVSLGDQPEELLRALEKRFPRARLLGGDAQFEHWVAAVVGFVEAPVLGLDLPLDVRGTAFQQRVWRALREIPPGATASYAEVAARIGAPGSARAVACACSANPIAVAIPCHRVVRSDGGLSGYRWGILRKKELLAREAGR